MQAYRGDGEVGVGDWGDIAYTSALEVPNQTQHVSRKVKDGRGSLLNWPTPLTMPTFSLRLSWETAEFARA